MKPVLLIAANFLREHRWPVLLMLAWVMLTALVAGGFGRERVAPDDVVFYVQQQAVYICIFSAFLAAHALHNERRSRRILLVLSKTIDRGEYLLAVILGIGAMAIVYALLFSLCGAWLAARAALPSSGMASIAVLIMAGGVLAASVALFFSTFLNPYLATGAALLLFCAPAWLHLERHGWSNWLPGLPILLDVLRFSFDSAADWNAALAAILESAVFWAMAAVVFHRKDIAVPVE